MPQSFASSDPSRLNDGTIRKPEPLALVTRLKRQYQANDEIRRGICLLNAGQYDAAARAFERATNAAPDLSAPQALIGACEIAAERPDLAAATFGEQLHRDPRDTTARIRCALALAQHGQFDRAVETLRDGLRLLPDDGKLHFQLGVLLAAHGSNDEAELRFAQAANLDPANADAWVNLAMCCAVRRAPIEALAHLQKAQALRPLDPRIGSLLAQAARAARSLGQVTRVRAVMPADPAGDLAVVDELVTVIASDADILDALLTLPVEPSNDRIFSLVAAALEKLIQRYPGRADFHFQYARAVEQRGERERAIVENERAVALDPTLSRALVELGRLYELTNRPSEAISRLERAADAGAAYADVYYRLGNLYRAKGELENAAGAYRRALELNRNYVVAGAALKSLNA